MKKYLFVIIIILFILSGCKKNIKHLNLITDDLNLFNVIDKFNSENDDIKIIKHYYKNVDNIDLFKYIIKNKISNYDLIIGKYFPHNNINSKYFYKLDTNRKFKINNSDKYYKAVNSFNSQHNNYLAIYSINFPVIVFKYNKYLKDYNNIYMNIDNFIIFSKKLNYKNINGKNNKINICFSPKLSHLTDLDYFFILNSKIDISKNNKISFNNNSAKKAFNFYYNFDNHNNYGSETTDMYIKKYNYIDNKNFFNHNVISSDFIHSSKIYNYKNDFTKFYLIKNLKYISLSQNAAAVNKKSRKKNESIIFINYLIQSEIQLLMTQNSFFNKNNYILENHFPIEKSLIKKIKESDFDVSELDKYIADKTYPNFKNNKVKNKFFEKYFITHEKINNGLISENDFLDYLNKELYK